MDIEKLSDEKLLLNLKKCVKNEKTAIALVVEHLGEVERRKLYSELKYVSLFEYCLKVLRYSEDQAYRRINAMHSAKRNPLIKEKLNNGELTLTNVNLFSSFEKEITLEKDHKDEVIKSISNTSKKECEIILNKFRPQEKTIMKSIRISSDTYGKIREVKQLTGANLEEAIEIMYKSFINNKNKNKNKNKKVVVKKISKLVGSKRYIPKAVKIIAINKSKGRCLNCRSKRNLQFDHILPFAKGGKSSVENIRVLCRNCNIREGIKSFGLKSMNRAGAERGS